MPTFKLLIGKSCLEVIESFHERERIKASLRDIEKNPYLGDKLKNSNLYKDRVGSYRILYEIDSRNKIIKVLNFRHSFIRLAICAWKRRQEKCISGHIRGILLSR